MKNNRKQKRVDSIGDKLKDWIVAEGLMPGDRLPQERQLIDYFTSSKGTVREALKSLETQGLIKTKTGPGGGAFVAETDENRAMVLLANYFFFSPPSIGDIYALRKLLEPMMARELSGKLRETDIKRLLNTVNLYKNPPTNFEEEYAQRLAELEFHGVLAELCPNRLLGFMCKFLQNLLKNLGICKKIYDKPNPDLREKALHFQLRLIDALQEGQTDKASEIMLEHMRAAQEYMEKCESALRKDFLKFNDS